MKKDAVRRWALPDRVFFGNGACHILAGVFLKSPPFEGFYAEKVTPDEGFSGNHIYVTNGSIAFDYHGYSSRHRLLLHHTTGWSQCSSEGWNCVLEKVDFNLLNTSELNAQKMRGPDQYAGDAISRAKCFIANIDHDRGITKAKLSLYKGQ